MGGWGSTINLGKTTEIRSVGQFVSFIFLVNIHIRKNSSFQTIFELVRSNNKYPVERDENAMCSLEKSRKNLTN